MVDEAESIPASWLPAIARIAGADDIADLLAATAVLLDAAVPNDLVVLGCQYTATAFIGGLPARAEDVDQPAANLTAQAILVPPPEQPTPLALAQMPAVEAIAARHGLPHGLAVSIPYRGTFGLTVMAYRNAEHGAFDAAATRAVAVVKPILSKAMERLLDQQQARALNKALLDFLNDLPVGLMMLDWDHKVLFVNREGRRQARYWPSSAVGRYGREDFDLPYAIPVACQMFHDRFMREMAAGAIDDATEPVVVTNPYEPTLRIAVDGARALDDPNEPFKYLVRFQGLATRVEGDFDPSPEQLKLLSQLTAAERMVALLVRQGLSNREISERLHREVSTVKDHLSHIFDKLAIRSRVQLARMLS